MSQSSIKKKNLSLRDFFRNKVASLNNHDSDDDLEDTQSSSSP